jgi:hypothetical protein
MNSLDQWSRFVATTINDFAMNDEHDSDMSRLEFGEDEDTTAFFGVVCWCLRRYFRHSDSSAREAALAFVNQLRGPDDVEWLHHDGPFWTALRIHHLIDLAQPWDDFTEWRVNQGYKSTPQEVHQYMQEHYFKR